MGQGASIKMRFMMSYIIAFAMIIGATVTSHLLVNQRLEQERSTAEIVNVSGAQRMLSQRVFALGEALTVDPQDTLTREFM